MSNNDQVLETEESPMALMKELFGIQDSPEGKNNQVLHQTEQSPLQSNSSGETIHSGDRALTAEQVCKNQHDRPVTIHKITHGQDSYVQLALKNSQRNEKTLTGGAKNGDDFSVDDLLDFSNEDDDVFVEDETELKVQRKGGVSDENTLHRSNDFSTGDIPTSELSVPMDDLAELEWLSNFVEGSFKPYSAAPTKKPVWLTRNRRHRVPPVNEDSCFKAPANLVEPGGSCSVQVAPGPPGPTTFHHNIEDEFSTPVSTKRDLVYSDIKIMKAPERSIEGECFDQHMVTENRELSQRLDELGSCKRCKCRKSKCSKLYCDCFAAGLYCLEPCSCQNCFNKPIHDDLVMKTRQVIEARNPLAFAPKVVSTSDSAIDLWDKNSKTPASARHSRGCDCRKSGCLQKYCECFMMGVGCSSRCRCMGCKNIFGHTSGSATSSSSSYGPSSPLRLADSEFLDEPMAKRQKQEKVCRNNGQTQTQTQTQRCSHCGVQETPQWRAGPSGAKTLCNACGVRYKSGRLLPEYRPK